MWQNSRPVCYFSFKNWYNKLVSDLMSMLNYTGIVENAALCSTVFCCVVAWFQPDISCNVWRWNQLRTFNRSWRISTTPNTTKNFLFVFKLIQQSNMVILSWLAKKNQNLNLRKKSSVYYWKLHFKAETPANLPFQ